MVPWKAIYRNLEFLYIRVVGWFIVFSGVLGFQNQPWGRMGWITNYIFHSNILGGLEFTNEETFGQRPLSFLISLLVCWLVVVVVVIRRGEK